MKFKFRLPLCEDIRAKQSALPLRADYTNGYSRTGLIGYLFVYFYRQQIISLQSKGRKLYFSGVRSIENIHRLGEVRYQGQSSRANRGLIAV